VVVTKPKKEIGFYGNIVAAPVFKELRDKLYAEKPIDTPDLEGKGASSYIGIAQELNDIHEVLSYPKEEVPQKNAWMKSEGKALMSLDLVEGSVPNVKGMSAMDALYLLENMGLEVELQGKGKVIRQSLKAGDKLGKNQKIALRLAS